MVLQENILMLPNPKQSYCNNPQEKLLEYIHSKECFLIALWDFCSLALICPAWQIWPLMQTPVADIENDQRCKSLDLQGDARLLTTHRGCHADTLDTITSILCHIFESDKGHVMDLHENAWPYCPHPNDTAPAVRRLLI